VDFILIFNLIMLKFYLFSFLFVSDLICLLICFLYFCLVCNYCVISKSYLLRYFVGVIYIYIYIYQGRVLKVCQVCGTSYINSSPIRFFTNSCFNYASELLSPCRSVTLPVTFGAPALEQLAAVD
jgi:hypothetical protein